MEQKPLQFSLATMHRYVEFSIRFILIICILNINVSPLFVKNAIG